MEAGDIVHPGKMGETAVANFGAGEIDPLHPGRDRLQCGELVIGKLFAHIQCAEAKLGRVLSDCHE